MSRKEGKASPAASRPGIDLLLQVLNLALQSIEVTGGLPTERIEFPAEAAVQRPDSCLQRSQHCRQTFTGHTLVCP